MGTPGFTSRERRLINSVDPLQYQPATSWDNLSASAGPILGTQALSETIQGFEPFREGDDPRKLDFRLSELFNMDIAREYEEPKLPSTLVLADLSSSVASSDSIARAIVLTAAAVSTALARGGHEVVVANDLPGRSLKVSTSFCTDIFHDFWRAQTRSKGKTGVTAVIDSLILERAVFGATVLITDTAWPKVIYCRVLRKLQLLTRQLTVLFLVPEAEFAPVTTYGISVPGSAEEKRAPAQPGKIMKRLLERLGSDTLDIWTTSPAVIRWDDERAFLSSLIRKLPMVFQRSRE